MASRELFTDNPKNIEKATLSPTANTNFVTRSSLFSLRAKIISIPGRNVRKRNPRSWRRTGISKNTARFVNRSIIIVAKRNCRALRTFSDIAYQILTFLQLMNTKWACSAGKSLRISLSTRRGAEGKSTLGA